MISNALQTMYGMVDMLVVGNYVGEAGLSAVNNASMLILLMMTLCMGFSVSGQIYVSQLFGAQKKEEINRAIGTLFTMLMAFAALTTLVSLTLAGPMLRLLHVPAEAMPMAKDYTMICGGGIVFSYCYNMITSVLKGMGESARPLLFIAIASVVNIVLDLLLVGGLGWGAAGAAWATIIGQTASFLFSLVFLYRRKESFGFDFKLRSFRPAPEAVRVYFRLGIPYAIQMSALSISMLFVNGLINTYGSVSCSAAFGVSNKIQHLPDILSRSIGMVTSSMVGQNLAAGKVQRAKKTVHVGLYVTTGLYLIMGLIVLLFSQELFGMFTGEESVLRFAWSCAVCMVISFPAHAMMKPTNAFVQGIGNARFSLVIALLDGVVARISLSWLLGVVLGQSFFGSTLSMGDMGRPFGFFLGYNLATYFTAVPATVYFFSERWRKRALLV